MTNHPLRIYSEFILDTFIRSADGDVGVKCKCLESKGKRTKQRAYEPRKTKKNQRSKDDREPNHHHHWQHPKSTPIQYLAHPIGTSNSRKRAKQNG
ncbi:hypothetical protein BDN72DRAFT_641415 [Pluteus cervinus]|uniref:Uncharacterized protein n=1 Tax=Pluteus cervinus TaxID=181527 RepID=A0ACD3AUI9_9AGAR|nr:hypothetical protein BDN72DRAFT_641415 [Pluteus cervinus]